MDNTAFPVEVVEAQQDLFGDLFDERDGNAPVVPLLDEAQKVLSEHLEDHTHVVAVGTFVGKGVEQTDDVFASGMVFVGLDDAFEKLDLIQRRLGIMGGGSDDFQGDVLAGLVIARQPDSGEMAPSQFANDGVLSVVVLLANVDGVVTAFAVVFGIFFVAIVVHLLLLGGRAA